MNYREIALQKCHAVEAEPASEEQTLASTVASVALDIAERFPHPDGAIQTLHRAVDFILATRGDSDITLREVAATLQADIASLRDEIRAHV